MGRRKSLLIAIKGTGQNFDSLKDLVTKCAERETQARAPAINDEAVLNRLTVKPATRPKRISKPFGMGDVVKFRRGIYIVKGFIGNYLGFVDTVDGKYDKNMKEAELIIKNQGIVCI